MRGTLRSFWKPWGWHTRMLPGLSVSELGELNRPMRVVSNEREVAINVMTDGDETATIINLVPHVCMILDPRSARLIMVQN